MLTRLEVNGFKNLLDFTIDFGPFTCIAGPNGVGKSNIFDSIRFLSLLSDHSLMEAALAVRGDEKARSDDFLWEPEDLFWTDGKDRRDTLHITAEMIVSDRVYDDFGREADATSTFLRYEIEIGFEEADRSGELSRLILLTETLDPITEGEAPKRLAFPYPATDFRKKVVRNCRRARSGFISTEVASDGQREILVHQDGGSRGPAAQKASAKSAPRTIVGTTNTSTSPTILAARREMQSWRFLALEPSAMRRTDRFYTDPHVTANGGHLAATLNRLTGEFESRDNSSVIASIASRLSEIVPVRDIRVDTDPVRQLLTLEVQERSGGFLPARSLSDGTLRFLTLCVLEQDSDFEGLLCMEEPENGIHPARMPAMVELLRDLAVDPQESPGPDNPLRQVIVATHSPPFVKLQDPGDLLYAQPTKVRGPYGSPAVTLRCRPQPDTWRVTDTDAGIGKGSIMSYLTDPPGAQIHLDIDEQNRRQL